VTAGDVGREETVRTMMKRKIRRRREQVVARLVPAPHASLSLTRTPNSSAVIHKSFVDAAS